MASAILASRNEATPCWGEQKVYMRKYTNNTTTTKSSNKKSSFLKLNPNPTPNPNQNQNQNQTRQIYDQSLAPAAAVVVAVSDDSTSPPNNRRSISLNEAKESSSSRAGHVTFTLGGYTRRELKELKNRLISELDQVRILRNRIESTNFSTRPVYPHDKQQHQQQTTTKPDHGKKKKVPGSGSSKRVNPFPDPNPKRQAIEEPQPPPPPQQPAQPPAAMEKLVSSMMKRCSSILTKLIKHKHGWVFKDPVDAEALNLHDYHQVIKNPMDLGTVKKNLQNGFYKSSPLDFANHVTLTFNNALTYNPKGHDVYTMAEILLKMFNDMFVPAFNKFEHEKRRIFSSQQQPQPQPQQQQQQQRRGEVLVVTSSPRFVGKLPKPKAKDPNKRMMSSEEKAKLGANLQELPGEKMVQIVNIVRKRNLNLAQDGDEIELDIETIDNETLWELDRFVCNFKKMVSKIKRQGLLQNPMMMGTYVNKESPVSEMAVEAAQKGKRGDVGEEDVDIGEEIPMGNYPPVEIEKDDAIACPSSRSSSSSSSSSSSGSSSSGSDSGSSSGSDSDADSVQSPFVETKEAH